MRYPMLAVFLFMLAAAISGCKKDESNPASGTQFVDKLSLGTGMTSTAGFPLTGEGTSFTRTGSPAAALIYWRLECRDDYGTGGARLVVERMTAPGTYTPHLNTAPPAPQSYGHIFVNGPLQFTTAGTYRATGYHVTSNRLVGTVDFTVN